MSDLKQCPFCGGEVEMRKQGNEWTKKRRIVVRCPKCRIERADAALKHGMEWLVDVAVKGWNDRPTEDALTAKLEALRVALSKWRYTKRLPSDITGAANAAFGEDGW